MKGMNETHPNLTQSRGYVPIEIKVRRKYGSDNCCLDGVLAPSIPNQARGLV